MRITLNGRMHEIEDGQSLSGLVTRLGLDGRKLAVERNLEIVPRSAYGSVQLSEGDRIEIVNFVGGG